MSNNRVKIRAGAIYANRTSPTVTRYGTNRFRLPVMMPKNGNVILIGNLLLSEDVYFVRKIAVFGRGGCDADFDYNRIQLIAWVN
jgi:hypothetical protein